MPPFGSDAGLQMVISCASGAHVFYVRSAPVLGTHLFGRFAPVFDARPDPNLGILQRTVQTLQINAARTMVAA
ncbi:hypothetical protein D3227_25030 [Mesorhizobium waimense]|uniref:Uncharacterized protein n=1 Tax=Mesorhizobium waimense TaxID=1300307 RepID=A0A3A5KQR1_9HYPH|nr:hypothetical protein D3227_25030 [Mesorhizobium waimense]